MRESAEDTWGRFPVAAVANVAKRVNERVSVKVDFSLDHTFSITSMEYPAQVGHAHAQSAGGALDVFCAFSVICRAAAAPGRGAIGECAATSAMSAEQRPGVCIHDDCVPCALSPRCLHPVPVCRLRYNMTLTHISCVTVTLT
jgi:hypothetical protein